MKNKILLHIFVNFGLIIEENYSDYHGKLKRPCDKANLDLPGIIISDGRFTRGEEIQYFERDRQNSFTLLGSAWIEILVDLEIKTILASSHHGYPAINAYYGSYRQNNNSD